ncbi:MAG TPA: glycosyltransferase [Acidimicrobiales bacterium]|nr:glycosyltransferase [Acidimicrobiales bacterium]
MSVDSRDDADDREAPPTLASLFGGPQRLRVAILSSAPPTPCGLATFTTALGVALARRGANVGVVRVLDEPDDGVLGELPVWAELIARQPNTRAPALRALNSCDVVFVQHEYGLYGGRDGSDVLRVLEGLHVPVVAILHTVLSSPTRHQHDVLNEVIRRSHHVVVMSANAEKTLRSANFVGATPLSIIPHGAELTFSDERRAANARPTLLTWGLLGPGKGIEWVIDALSVLRDLDPVPHYVVAGRTHPKVLAREGDRYRAMLQRRVVDNDVSHMVSFDDSYRNLASLQALILSADVVVLPYDSKDQATSGVLVDALAAGRPLIATAFPHALETLSDGAGIVVTQYDTAALAAAIRHVLVDHELATTMASAARRAAQSLSWDAVAEKYALIAEASVAEVSV